MIIIKSRYTDILPDSIIWVAYSCILKMQKKDRQADEENCIKNEKGKKNECDESLILSSDSQRKKGESPFSSSYISLLTFTVSLWSWWRLFSSFFYFQVNLTWIVVVMIMIIVVCCELLLLLQVAQCRCISTWIDFTWEIMDNPFFPLLWLLHLYSLWTLHYNMMGCYAVVSE